VTRRASEHTIAQTNELRQVSGRLDLAAVADDSSRQHVASGGLDSEHGVDAAGSTVNTALKRARRARHPSRCRTSAAIRTLAAMPAALVEDASCQPLQPRDACRRATQPRLDGLLGVDIARGEEKTRSAPKITSDPPARWDPDASRHHVKARGANLLPRFGNSSGGSSAQTMWTRSSIGRLCERDAAGRTNTA
jgi:hypothetical protein